MWQHLLICSASVLLVSIFFFHYITRTSPDSNSIFMLGGIVAALFIYVVVNSILGAVVCAIYALLCRNLFAKNTTQGSENT